MGKPFTHLSGKRVLNRNTYTRLKNEAIVVTADERRVAAKLHASNKKQLKTESENRKAELQKYDTIYRTKGPKLAQLDKEVITKTSYLLNMAYEMRQDQEDEIKQCNSLILGTKCHAIRCAQIEEKELIQKELKKEERRIEMLMEQERIMAAKKYEKAVEADRLKKKLQATDIVQQIKKNEMAREFEAAKTAEEARVHKEASIEAQRVEVKDLKEKLIKQAEMRREFLQINAQLKDMKQTDKELARIEVLQIQEYDRKKNEREMAFEEEMRKQKLMKEKEIAKMQANQKAFQDLQAAKDELSALRTQDKIEREWRRKELEDTIKKIKTNKDLKEARQRQIKDQRESCAYEIQREKEEFNKIIKLNVNDIEKIKEEDRQFKMKTDKHRTNLLKQIKQKEMEKIQEKKMYFQAGIKYQEDQAARKKSLRDTMEKKIEGLRANNLPAKYILRIERQFKLKE